ncbi:MAG: glycine cleavage system aminomethyltransferase GcvT [Chloroflexota bacterium]|nr:glycine cleavage system aminomethyltransferase GcvT [Chloroflexota bacterium]
MEGPKRTPLYDTELKAGARMTMFAGWELPVQFSGILTEHRAVRSRAGLFDVSHMGRIEIEGKESAAFLQKVSTRDPSRLSLSTGHYTLLLRENGGILDDCVVFRQKEESFLLICNAASLPQVFPWLNRWAHSYPSVSLRDVTGRTAMLAFQGPLSAQHLDLLCQYACYPMRRFACSEETVHSYPALVSRTGYTGEDGFELVLAPRDAASLWRDLLAQGVTPCGLGARDTLRLEAGLLLYGQDMDLSTTPWEVGLDRFVSMGKDDFIGRAALLEQKAKGLRRKLIGFEMVERGIPRHGCTILSGGKPVGKVTSGSYAPTLEKSIGLGYVPLEYAAPGTSLVIDIRGKPAEARVVPLPFYRRPGS